MAGSKSDIAEGLVLDWLLGIGTPTRPAACYVALFTVAPSDGAGGTEVAGGSYARQAVTMTRTGSSVNPTATVTFPTATADWGTVAAFAIMDALTVGNVIYWGTVTTPKAVNTGDTAEFATTDLTITED